MRFTVAAAAASSLLVVAPAAFADQCGRAWTLDLPPSAALGDSVDVELTGPANEMALLMVSTTTGSTPSKYGDICVGFPLAFTVLTDLDANGAALVTSDVPCDPSFVGLTAYLQFITCSPNAGSSNLASITIEDAICVGDLVTFEQDGFDKACEDGSPSCRFEEAFDALFPNGITLGDQDGIDGDGEYALVFTSAKAVEKFLPVNGPVGVLTKDATDPTESHAGKFAGDLLVAKITVALDAAGKLDDLKGRHDLILGDLVFAAGVNPDLFDLRVQDVLDLADLFISGALTGDVDIDGDGIPDATIGDVSDALNALNANFDNGTVNLGTLRK
jgi:hypothetical protein